MSQGININPDSLDQLKCDCGSIFFQPIVMLKIVPPLLAGNPSEMVIPFPEQGILACQVCGTLVSDLMEKRESTKSALIL